MVERHKEPLVKSDAILLCLVAAVPVVVLAGVAIGAKALTSNNAAAWVQALGSLLAVGIAIYVPYNLHVRDFQRQRESELARAHVVAASVALMVNPAVGMLQAFVDEANAVDLKHSSISAREWHNKFITLVKPTDEQILILEPGSRGMALALARGFNQVEQMKQVFVSLYNRSDARSVTLQLVTLIPLARLAIAQLSTAEGLMDKFVSSIEGPEVITSAEHPPKA